MVTLASADVAVRVDAGHGGEVLDLIDLRSGRQLLGRPPFASDQPVPGELDETTWTRCYRGGWQLLVPNAGNPCVVDDVAHGFHGRASTEPWEIVERSGDAATLVWRGHGLQVARRFSLRGDTVTVRSTVRAERAASFVWVEHIGLGIELLDPSVEIQLGGGSAYEVSEQAGPATPPPNAGSWPEVRLLDGTLERADRALLTAPRSRLLIVAAVPEGRLVVRNRDRRQGLEIRWDRDWLPHLWIWHEVRTSGGPWRALTETLVVEPASVPHTLGLRTARELGQAHRLEAGEQAETEVLLRPLLGRRAMSGIRLESVTKVFAGGVRAVDSIDLEIADGEFLVLVGPSGCGKTTLLRMIAGIETATSGAIWIGDEDVTGLESRLRDIAMVFQNYALYPHMTARQNLGFGLRLRRVPKREITERVDAVASMLGLDELLGRKPSELSGGQRQRVAIGRAIVREPQAYLMDEPLSNLDAKLRVGMRAELARLHARLGVTTVYVTHDQAEAMTLGDRVAVLRGGTLQQCDDPQTLFAEPVNLFVAAFIGSPSMNLVEARLEGGSAVFANHRLPLPPQRAWPQDRVVLGLRPSDLLLAGPGVDPALPRLTVRPSVVERLGDQCHVVFSLDAPSYTTGSEHRALDPDMDEAQILAGDERAVFTAVLDGLAPVSVDREVELAVNHRRMYLFDPRGGALLWGPRSTGEAHESRTAE